MQSLQHRYLKVTGILYTGTILFLEFEIGRKVLGSKLNAAYNLSFLVEISASVLALGIQVCNMLHNIQFPRMIDYTQRAVNVCLRKNILMTAIPGSLRNTIIM